MSRPSVTRWALAGVGEPSKTIAMVMMAAMTAEELDDFLRARSRSARGGSMLRTPGKLRSFLDGVRREGAAALVKPDGVTAVAAPVTGTSGEVVAAIGVSAPSSRMGKAERKAVEGEVRASAEVISRRLGYG